MRCAQRPLARLCIARAAPPLCWRARFSSGGGGSSRCSSSSAAPPAPPLPPSAGDGFMRHGPSEGLFPPSSSLARVAVDSARTEITFSIENRPGGLADALSLFAEAGLSLSHIESRQTKTRSARVSFLVNVVGTESDPAVAAVLAALRSRRRVLSVATLAPPTVPWFPTSLADIDAFSRKTLDAGAELESDHPGFQDAAYRERRRAIVAAAGAYRSGQPIPRVDYTAQETATWRAVYQRLRRATVRHAVDSYNEVLPQLERQCGYSAERIPQLEDISAFLRGATGFTLRPVAGLLSARDFLNGLALRVFFSTQYIRHHTRPLYTPEPDVCHELLGHAPMFADPDFADFSHEIGLASLGASDEDIKRLATCYWFSVEFGLALQRGERRAYGAGLLSSFGELEYACGAAPPSEPGVPPPEFRPWDPKKAAAQPYPITKYQPVYFVAESLKDAKQRMRDFCETLHRGFLVTYDPATQTVSADRAIVRGDYLVTLQT